MEHALRNLDDIGESMKSVGNTIASHLNELRLALNSAGHAVPHPPDRKIHLTLDQAEKLEKFWYAISDIAESDLIDDNGETVLKLIIESVNPVFSGDLTSQITEVRRLERGAA
jgi:hypothetical protein